MSKKEKEVLLIVGAVVLVLLFSKTTGSGGIFSVGNDYDAQPQGGAGGNAATNLSTAQAIANNGDTSSLSPNDDTTGLPLLS